jgi:hypothetical protein
LEGKGGALQVLIRKIDELYDGERVGGRAIRLWTVEESQEK